jgi:hypothetical protein
MISGGLLKGADGFQKAYIHEFTTQPVTTSSIQCARSVAEECAPCSSNIAMEQHCGPLSTCTRRACTKKDGSDQYSGQDRMMVGRTEQVPPAQEQEELPQELAVEDMA